MNKYNTLHTAVAKFIVPYGGDKLDYGIGLSYRRPDGLARQPICHIVNFIPPVRDYELGLCIGLLGTDIQYVDKYSLTFQILAKEAGRPECGRTLKVII
jgi:hypothetical protein